jgi:hypothetical protein
MIWTVLSIIGGVIGFLLAVYLVGALTYNKQTMMEFEKVGDTEGADRYIVQHLIRTAIWFILLPILFICLIVFVNYAFEFIKFILGVFLV